MDTKAIISLTTSCRRILDQLTVVTAGSSSDDQAWAEVQLQRLNIWADVLGIFAKDKLSITYRLASNQQVTNVIIQLLQALYGNLEICRSFLGYPSALSTPNVSPQPESDDKSSLASDDESDDATDTEDRLKQRKDHVEGGLARLGHLAMRLRRDGAKRAAEAAKTFEPMDESGDLLAADFAAYIDSTLRRAFQPPGQIVSQETDPKNNDWPQPRPDSPVDGQAAVYDAKTEPQFDIPDYLQERLRQTMIQRWRRICYNRHHTINLARPSEPAVVTKPETPSTIATEALTSVPVSETPVIDEVLSRPMEFAPRAKTMQTAATVLSERVVIDSQDLEPKPTKTITTKVRAGDLSFPPAPVVAKGVDVFVCSFCGQPRPVALLQQRKKWQSHVMQDLAPYICTFEHCTQGLVSYSTSDEWLEHIRAQHADNRWSCNLCDEPSAYTDATQYSDHLYNMHDEQHPDAKSVALFVGLGKQSVMPTYEQCCFCGFVPPEYIDNWASKECQQLILDHMSKTHMQYLALSSMPWDIPGSVDSSYQISHSSGSGSESAKRSIMEADDLLPEQSTEDEGQDLVPSKEIGGSKIATLADIKRWAPPSISVYITIESWRALENEAWTGRKHRDWHNVDDRSWAEFYELTKEDMIGRDRKEIEAQNVLHEIVTTEGQYIRSLQVWLALFRDPLQASDPPIIPSSRSKAFLDHVFGKAELIMQINAGILLPQLQRRQAEQGPWISMISDIFSIFIRAASVAYIEYAEAFPTAVMTVQQEMETNDQFTAFLERMRASPKAGRLGWDSYIKAPLMRMQRYTLLLDTVVKNMKDVTQADERANIMAASGEIRVLAKQCDEYVTEMSQQVELQELSRKLVLRPEMQKVDLDLMNTNRKLLHRGNLRRMNRTWIDVHALLFDHYLVLGKPVSQRSPSGQYVEKYDISKPPIPMDLLALQATIQPVVRKRELLGGYEFFKGLRPRSGQQGGADTNNTLFPFEIQHLSGESYTLYASSERERRDWYHKIIEAKKMRAAMLVEANAEPFSLKVIAQCFASGAAVQNADDHDFAHIGGSCIDRALKAASVLLDDPPLRARMDFITCATSFIDLGTRKKLVAVGTRRNLYILNNEWDEFESVRTIGRSYSATPLLQLAVIYEHNLLLLVTDGALRAADIKSCLIGPTKAFGEDEVIHLFELVSGRADVEYFTIGKMQEETVVLCKDRGRFSSSVKVLRPSPFEEEDSLSVAKDATSIDVFHRTISISTPRSCEVLSLDRKTPMSVPSSVPAWIERRLKNQKPLRMVPLGMQQQEYLLCYDTCAVYIDRHGLVSRTAVMEFVGTAQVVASHRQYLILFGRDFVEIRDSGNGELKQIIPGTNIQCLDNGSSTLDLAAQSVKLRMQHPLDRNKQVMFELVLNEGH